MDEIDQRIEDLYAELQECLEVLETEFGACWMLNPRCWNVPNEYTRRQYLRMNPKKRLSIKTWSGLYDLVTILENFIREMRSLRGQVLTVSQPLVNVQIDAWTLKVNYSPCLNSYAKDYCELLAYLANLLLRHYVHITVVK